MSNLVEKLLQPISENQPCGPDLSYDPRFDELETILKGQPEVEMGSVVKPAEPPDWRHLKGAALEFLGASKHLRVASMLCTSLLKVDGLPGFRDGLQVIRGLLEQYWAPLYPLLDPEDNNDPQQRLNILSGLTTPRLFVMGSWTQIIDYLYTAPLCRPKGAPPITLDDFMAASKKKEAGADGSVPAGPDLGQLNKAFQSANLDEVKANYQAVTEALEAVAGIDAFLTSTLGASGTISFDKLQGVLQQIERTLAPRVGGAVAAASAGESAAAGSEASSAAAADGGAPIFAGVSVSGSIRSRDDVVRTLESICDYYQQVEPGSPVPFLLRRAQKLAKMNFFEAMQELALASPDQLRPIMGTVIDEAVAAAAPPPQ